MKAARGTGRTHSGSRLIKASPEAIYRALTDADAIAAWRAPQGMRARILELDLREGGGFRMALEYQGADHPPGKSSPEADIVRGRYGRLVPGRQVVELVEFDSDDPAFAGTMVVTTHLEPVEGGTEVTIRCEDVPEGISEADHQAGIASSLANLARYTE